MEKPTGERRGRIAYEPALDGLRGLALLGMLCFHSEFSWAVGGFLPIATFFTLSGYLITSLFLVERESSGTIRLGAFWSRRLRRLMPAALLTLGGMSLFGAFVASPDQLARLRGDVFWALAYLANWRFLLSEVAYAQLFEAPSPVQHFWSLAIEEQFYLLFPLVTFAGMRIGGGSRLVLALVVGGLAAASVLTSVALSAGGASVDRVYYGTDTRGVELLLGALLALALCGRAIRSETLARALEVTGVVSLVGMLGLWTSVELDSSWLYSGGFAAYSLLSVAVITAGVQPSGLVRVLLSGRVLRWIGKVSYGAYLFHWPVYLWLSPERTGLDVWPLFALRVAVTFGLAAVSYRFLESPIRAGRALVGWRPFVATPAAFAAVALAAIAVTAGAQSDGDLASAAQQLAARQSETAGLPARRGDVPRVAFYGDSTAVRLAVAFDNWSRTPSATMPTVRGVAELGCGLMRQGTMRYQGRIVKRPQKCAPREKTWARKLRQQKPDLVVVSYGPWEVPDRLLPRQKTWQALGDEAVDAYLRRELSNALEILTRNGALVVWLTYPAIETRVRGTQRLPPEPFSESDPARMARLNELIREAAELHPESVRVADLQSYMRGLPGGEMDASYRRDGVHLTRLGSARVVKDWLAAEILRIYRETAPATGG